MADPLDDLEGLSSDERARLDAFARAFDRLDATAYAQLTEVVAPADVEQAQATALDALGRGPRRTAIRAAVAAFVDAATLAYSRRTTLTDTFLMNQSLPDRAEDRLRFLAGVERAVVALVLWDELEPESRATLLGPWGGLVEGLD